MKKVIFDLDGTLYQTHISVLQGMKDTLKEFQLPPLVNDEIIWTIGKSFDQFIRELLPETISFDVFRQRMRHHEYNAVRDCGKLFPGVMELLSELKKHNYLLYICSNGSVEYLELVLQCTGIKHLFTEVISTKYTGSKSDAIKKIITNADCAVMVGDTSTDFIGAKKAGIPSIAVTYGYGSEAELNEANYLATTMEEILEHIKQIELFT
ncbi:MAG: HAD-superfamily hydrolase, subfamily variant 1 [Herbinix sp.]|jgi:phosphoglycolate phosphatase|nr:HAD-superfamily hydrolase, subfamily variant 1 [Herbinix sp.]